MHRHTKNLSSQKYKYNIEISSQAHFTTSRKKHSFHLNYILYSNSINNKQTRTNTQLLSFTLNVIDQSPTSNQGLIAFRGGGGREPREENRTPFPMRVCDALINIME